ncbi:pyridoxamine 5'-phosphate oxidase family protein [Paenibacillus sp. MWE-103]|uniref:Pyridoxamine 5'-phosphate oxidase family protein n=1 Tax=Paenibacillus artemisiicola TaxID=1172618 RepID=A0ABS3WCQ0_9BACL|nr:pyridoxamine 5'-phosphate oxidase family protein [Paenibacillus artemisiicola]MBO7746104.1 pyridoxamine 5'-phosphate oxidase family protein [Paenibacillus artemisiicola]
MKPHDDEAIRAQMLNFVGSLKTLVLSTVDELGSPYASYAPFVRKDGLFYVYLSRIADHYRHLERSPLTDALLIEDESRTANPFARRRARFACRAENLGNEGHEAIFALFAERFGQSTIAMLRGLDFSLFALEPRTGRYVAGFGRAYDIDPAGGGFAHVDRAGHGGAEQA